MKEVRRFVLAGALNTALGFMVFSSLVFLVGEGDFLIVAPLIAHAVVSPVAFALHKSYVFRSRTGRHLSFLRSQAAYLPGLVLNGPLLKVVSEIFDPNVYWLQALILVAFAAISFVVHRFWVFR